MNFKGVLRPILCLLVVCCLLVNLSPIKAEATAAAGTIASVASVSGPAGIVVGAAIIALGVYAGTQTGALQNVVNSAVSYLDAAGGWIKNGSMELLKTVDAAGKATYYVAGDLLETLRGWLISDSGVLVPTSAIRTFLPEGSTYGNVTAGSDAVILKWCSTYQFQGDSRSSYEHLEYIFSLVPGYQYVTGFRADLCIGSPDTGYWGKCINGASGYLFDSDISVHTSSSCGYSYLSGRPSVEDVFSSYGLSDYLAAQDLTLGNVSSVPIDGTSAREWSDEYADRRLYVVNGSGGDPGNNNNRGKWFWPIVAAATVGATLVLTQENEWSGDTPSEFPEEEERTDFDFVEIPEEDGVPGIEITPVEAPNPGTGGDEIPDPGETEGEAGSGTDYSSWLEKIYKSIIELPNSFKTWISDCKTAIEELPSKFESWISDCKTAVEELPSKFADWFHNLSQGLSNIWEELKTIPQKIADAIGQVLQNLFVPSEGFLQAKVDALAEKFPFAKSIAETGISLKNFFFSLGSRPPIIYIDLGAATSWYPMGGKVAFLDLTWYAQYKPTMDVIISSFLWLCFAWRMLLSLPGILNGTSGLWGNKDTGSKAGKEVSER